MLTVEEFLNSHKSCKFMLISVAKGSGVLGSTSILTYKDKDAILNTFRNDEIKGISLSLDGKVICVYFEDLDPRKINSFTKTRLNNKYKTMNNKILVAINNS